MNFRDILGIAVENLDIIFMNKIFRNILSVTVQECLLVIISINGILRYIIDRFWGDSNLLSYTNRERER